MRRVLASVVPAIVLFATSSAFGTPPFGGDDGGFVSPSAPIKRCEEAVLLQTFKKYASCVIKCHVKAAKAALGGKPFDEEACEQSCTTRFEAKAQSAVAGGGCPSCLDFPGQQAIAAQVESFLDGENALIYCAGTTPFGDDDGGFVPPDKLIAKCEEKVAKNLKKLLRCIRTCHFKSGRQAFRGEPYDDEPCELGCRLAYERLRDKLLAKPGCPTCLDAGGQNTIEDDGEDFADQLNGAIYCASPSGAFVD